MSWVYNNLINFEFSCIAASDLLRRKETNKCDKDMI